MDIQLNNPYTIQPAITTNTVTRHQVIDDTTAKTVTAIVIVGKSQTGDNIYKTLELWQGEAYDLAGQWTDTDVNNRIAEILNQ